MATTDTVLQPGSEDLSGFTGPAGPSGPQGTTGATGPIGSGQMLSILAQYDFTNVVSSFSASDFSQTYLLANGSRFIASGSQTWAVAVATSNDVVTGTLSNFLVTATDAYAVQLTRCKALISGSAVSSLTPHWCNIEIMSIANNSITWRLVFVANGNPVRLSHISNFNLTQLEFSLLISAQT